MNSNESALLALLAKQFSDLRAAFRTLSKQQGPQGERGEQGARGERGEPGPVGADGKDGRPGRDGKDGRPVRDGKDGADGRDGKDGERGPMPDHEWKGTKLRFQKPEGGWGKFVDLKGPKGDAGGSSFFGGGGGVSLDGLPLATNDTPNGFVVRQGSTWAVATYEQMATWLGGSGPVITDALQTEGGDFITTESGDIIVQD